MTVGPLVLSGKENQIRALSLLTKAPFFVENPMCEVQACDGKGRAVKSWQPKQLLESGPKFKKMH